MAKKGRNPIKNKKYNGYIGSKRAFNRGSGLSAPPRLNVGTERLLSNYDYNEIISFSRYLYLNSGVAKGAIDLKSLYSIGNAFKIKSLIKDDSTREIYDRYIDNITNSITIKGENLDSLLYDTTIALDVDGDCFINLTYSTLTKYPKVQLITADRVKGTKSDVKGTKFDSENYNVQQGIISNLNGFEVAYIIDGYIVSGQSILHIKDNNPYSGVRGVPLFAHAIRELKYIEQIQQSELHAGKIASSLALIETNESGTDSYDTDSDVISSTDSNDNKIPTQLTEHQSGQIWYLKAGDGSKIETLKFERPNPNWQEFEKRLINNALTGAGIPNIFENDLTSGNVRANLQMFDRVCKDRYDLLKSMTVKIMQYALAYVIVNHDLPIVDEWDSLLISQPLRPSVDINRDDKTNIELYKLGLKALDDFIPSGMTKEQFINETMREKALKIKAKQHFEKEYNVIIPD